MFLMVGVVQAAFTLQDQNLAAYDYNARIGLESDSTNHRYCQKVTTPANSVDITQLEFYIVSKSGSFSAGENLIIEFGTSCGDDSLSSDAVPYSTLPSSGAYNMTISDATVSTAASYYITFTHENLDANEYIYLEYSRGSGDNYANGASYRSIDFGGFGAFNWDMLFTTFSTEAPPAIDSLNISDSLPANNTQFNTLLLSFNLTVNASLPFNADLYINGTLNQTGLYSSGSNKLVDFNVSFSNTTEATFTYFFALNTSLDNENTTTKVFHIDNVFPQITTNFVNDSIYFNTNITGTFNLTDNLNLFSYNISIDGVEIDSAYNLNTTFYNYNLTTPSALYKPGSHTLTVRTADGHTAQELYKPDEWEIDSGYFDSYIEFETSKNIEITIDTISSSIFDEFEVTQEADRFKWSFEPFDDSKSSYIFTVETGGSYIHIIENDPNYQDYLIINEHWLDFLLETEENEIIEVTRISDTAVQVNVSGITSSSYMEFESIGDLNIISRNFTFLTVNATSYYVDPVIETQTTPTYITLNITGTNLTSDDINLTFFEYNESTMTSLVSKNSDESTFINFSLDITSPFITNLSEDKFFNWSFDINGNVNESEIIYNHTVLKIGLYDCAINSSFMKALDIYSYNEEISGNNFSDLVDDITVHMDIDVWFEDEGLSRDFSFDFTGSNNYSICLYPNSSTYLIDSVLEYSVPGFADRKYFLENYTISNETRTLNLYNLNDSIASDISFFVYDKNTGDIVEDIYIKILRYYPEGVGGLGGTYSTVEIERTDDNGQTLGKMVLADVFYKFILQQGTTTILETDVQKMLSTSKTFGINLGSDILESFSKINNVDVSVDCEGITKTCSFTWSDTTNLVQTGTLEVYRINGYGKQLLSTQTTSSAAGTLTYLVTENTEGNEYLAQGYIHTNTANSNYLVGSGVMRFVTDLANYFGMGGLFPIMLLIISISAAFIGIGTVGVVAGSLIGLIGGVTIGLIPMSITTLITFIIMGAILIGKLRS